MSLRLVLASGNAGKLAEFRRAFLAVYGEGLELVSAAEAGVHSFPPETGSSYEENAFAKAAYVATNTGLPSLGDDSGLEVDALMGAPGIYSARFGGNLQDGERIAYLLQRLRHVPQARRGASFVCALVLATPGGGVHTFRGECRGEILQGPRGELGFGYDPIFYSPELGKSFAQATRAEKRRVSHRGRALDKVVTWLATNDAQRHLTPLVNRS